MVNIIGLSGQKQSGKDTVAKIIKAITAYYEANKAPYGYDMNGFVLDIVSKWYENEWVVDDLSEWEIKSFAHKIKQITCILLGCTMEQLEDSEFKETPLGKEWWKIELVDPAGQVEYKPYSTYQECFEEEFRKRFDVKEINTIKITPRKLMQLLGKECGRDILHPSIWLNSLFADYKSFTYEASEMSVKEGKPAYEDVLPKWIISDIRFPNEFDAVKRRNGIVVRVERSGSEQSDSHSSETALDNHTFDYTIHNSGGIPDLVEKIHDMLKHFHVISTD